MRAIILERSVGTVRHSAADSGDDQLTVHLEMRDAYTPSDRSSWTGNPPAAGGAASVGGTTCARAHGRGVRFSAPGVSEPSRLHSFEYRAQLGSTSAGGRSGGFRAAGVGPVLPGNDFWLFDDSLSFICSPGTANRSGPAVLGPA